MKQTPLFLFTLLLSLVFATGCCDCRKRSKLEKPLIGTEWELVQIMANDIVAEGDSYRITFMSNGTMVGKGDCNVFTATYSVTSQRALEISNMGATRKYCQNFEEENRFFDMLEAITHYEMDADHMLLLSNGTLVGILRAASNE